MFTELKHNRTTILILGKVNSGKSSLFNFLINQNLSIVSGNPGTTSDPVSKAIEFLNLGPVLIIDSAGFLDNSSLQEEREKKSLNFINSSDILVVMFDSKNFNIDDIEVLSRILDYAELKPNINLLLVISKIDLSNREKIDEIKENLKNFIKNHKLNFKIHFTFFEISVFSTSSQKDLIVSNFEKSVSLLLPKGLYNKSLLKNFITKKDIIVSVIYIDSMSPKKRLILPQVEVIRDILDNSGISVNLTLNEYADFIKKDLDIKLVIADSTIAKDVFYLTPKNINFITFSVLYAFYKSDFSSFLYMIESVKILDTLENFDKILISEACTHHSTKDDIGKQKIPKLIEKYTNKHLIFDFSSGINFPENLENYKLIIQCGGCMINNNLINYRVSKCISKNVPITNYGMVITKCSGNEIFEKIIKFFTKNNL